MNPKYKNLIKNILFFLIAGVIPKLASFVLIPIYTSNLSTEEFGIAELIVSAVNILLPMLTLEIQDAVMRFALDDTYSKKDVFSTGINISLFGGLILFCIEAALYFAGVIHCPLYILLYLGGIYIVDATNVVVSYFCRGLDKVKVLTQSSIVSSIVSFFFGYCLVSHFKLGIHGYLITNIITNFSTTIYIIIKTGMGNYYSVLLCKKVANSMIKFSAPLIISALSWWVNNASDKYILDYFIGTSIVGVYAVASKIPNILSTFGTIIAKAFSISAIKEYDVDDKDGFLGSSYSLICAGIVSGCSVILLFNIPLSKILFANEFFDAWKYTPLLLLSVAFNQMALSCQNIFIAQDNTKIISVTAAVGAGLNTVLNFALIPRFGAYGAAVATAVGFFAVWVSRYCVLKEKTNLKNDFIVETVSFVFLTGQVVASMYGQKYILIEILFCLCIVVTYRRMLLTAFKHIKDIIRAK